jgi:hypothetical protein
MIDIKIRYNHNCNDDKHYWRLIIDNVEYLASDINILVPTKTTRDEVFDLQRNEMVNKHHISCKAESVNWINSGIAEIK